MFKKNSTKITHITRSKDWLVIKKKSNHSGTELLNLYLYHNGIYVRNIAQFTQLLIISRIIN